MKKKKSDAWVNNLTSEQRLGLAREKVKALIGQLDELIAVKWTNKHIIYSKTLSNLIPKSYAANAFNQLQNSLHKYAIIRTMAIWDSPAKDRNSVPTVKSLLDHPDVQKLLLTEIFKYHSTLAQPNTTTRFPIPTELNALLSERWKIERVEIAKQAVAVAKRELRSALRATQCVERSGTYESVTRFRHQRIAHNLSSISKEASELGLPKLRYGDENKLLSIGARIIVCLHRSVNESDFAFQMLDKNWKNCTAELWDNCTFSIPSTGTKFMKR
ncbi:hypothetical protein E7811_15310 [Aliigemmobacter aestuarii]|uniref:HEPN AbiU2-like domain-containing protein n=1 Tax=Aliigemmobacter aestuarii TaxID=1445661 RepID=A0A4S3MLF2_9RHOB|nr:hypothetical protein [Gemmobacter aestuarii]THD82410.1 hypothetical protein E7811_15310 [Gemmobacter aestuarii]